MYANAASLLYKKTINLNNNILKKCLIKNFTRSLSLGYFILKCSALKTKKHPFLIQNPLHRFFYCSHINLLENTITLTKEKAQTVILRMTDEERTILFQALQEFESEKTKAEYEGQLAGVRWRSKFGRPSKLPTLGDVDPTGSYCPVPEDWLMRKYAESVPPPDSGDLVKVVIHNAVPFVGFGFLDNFLMIIAGDYIEMTLGSFMVLSTMAAAALGNTISDVCGIGSAFYVEKAAYKVGMKPPPLTPVQLDMPVTRRCANLGRVIGVTCGCLLGMLPLLFLNKNPQEAEEESS